MPHVPRTDQPEFIGGGKDSVKQTPAGAEADTDAEPLPMTAMLKVAPSCIEMDAPEGHDGVAVTFKPPPSARTVGCPSKSDLPPVQSALEYIEPPGLKSHACARARADAASSSKLARCIAAPRGGA